MRTNSNITNYVKPDPRIQPGINCTFIMRVGRDRAAEISAKVVSFLGEKSAIVNYICPVTKQSVNQKTLLIKLKYQEPKKQD